MLDVLEVTGSNVMQMLAPLSIPEVEVLRIPSVKQVTEAPSAVEIVTVLAVCQVITPLTV